VQSFSQPEVLFEEAVLSVERTAALFSQGNAREVLLENGVLVADRSGGLRIKFVGIVVADGRSFQILPKVFSESAMDVAHVMRHVVRALRRYARWRPQRHEGVPFLEATGKPTELNALAIADWIIRDYLNAGIYRRLKEREEINGTGQSNWRRTVERMAPLVSAGRPVYVDIVTRSAARDHDHFVSRLHRQIVDTAARAFGHLLGFAPIDLDHEPFEPFSVMPSVSYSQVRLRQEMRQAFSDRTIQLLPMLLAWLEAWQRANEAGLALYGTTAFYNVWEQACSLAIGNERDGWQMHIPKPTWRSSTGHSQSAATFEPDIVTRVSHQGCDHLLIADAKYYQLSMPPQLSGQPGVNDVAKQLWYERCLSPAARARGMSETHNIFVVPGPERSEAFWSDGEVELGGLPETTVKVKRLSALSALERYADGAALDPARVRAVVLPVQNAQEQLCQA
jgi:hypothetical protein